MSHGVTDIDKLAAQNHKPYNTNGNTNTNTPTVVTLPTVISIPVKQQKVQSPTRVNLRFVG